MCQLLGKRTRTLDQEFVLHKCFKDMRSNFNGNQHESRFYSHWQTFRRRKDFVTFSLISFSSMRHKQKACKIVSTEMKVRGFIHLCVNMSHTCSAASRQVNAVPASLFPFCLSFRSQAWTTWVQQHCKLCKHLKRSHNLTFFSGLILRN